MIAKETDNIIEKVKKLLKMTKENGASENEVQVALTKARKLMIEYKLQMSDIEKENIEIVDRETKFYYTSVYRPWIANLMEVLANKYCCFWYITKYYRKRARYVSLSGNKDDVELLESIIEYCINSVRSVTMQLIKSQTNNYDAYYEHTVESSVAEGFCDGLFSAFKDQDSKNADWALVATVPQEAILELDVIPFNPREYYTHTDSYNSGYEEGYNYGTRRRLYTASIGEN